MADRFESNWLRRAMAVVALLLAQAFWAPQAQAQHTSAECPAQTGTVTAGGTVTINISDCEAVAGLGGVGPIDGGSFGPADPENHGTAVTRHTGGQWFLDYSHNGTTGIGSTDVFELSDGSLAGTGDVRFTITITASASPITVSPSSLPTLTAGTPYSQTVTASGGASPYTYALQSGVLPVGLTLSSSGVLSGTPTERGAYSFSVRATDSTTPTAQFTDKGYTGNVASPSLALVSNSGTAIQGTAFSQTLATSGGVAPYSYLLETGSLPAGLTLSAGGVISGTTNAAPGNYPVTSRVTDSSTGPGSYFEVENFTLTVSPAPSVSIAVSPASVSEDGATNLTYTVTRSLNLSSATTVNITTTGTAGSGTDYAGGVASVTIPAGATTATITINPAVDGTVEADETVTLSVAAGSGYTVGAPSSATGTILNDDVPTATLSVSPAAVAEDGAPNLVYTVTLDQASFSAMSIGYTAGGTAANGTDYATISSPLVIPAGSTTGTITVNPTADATIESDETVTLTLSAGAGYAVGVPNTATGTILNDDLPNLTINDVTLNEGNAGIINATFTVSLSAPAGPGGVTFSIATANGSATAGTDYVAQSLTSQTIPAGSSTYTFTVLLNGDTRNEPSETYFVNVTNVINAVVVDGQGVGTIVNDDPLPSLTINDVTVTEGASGTTNAVFTVTLSTPSGQTVGVNYATADGTATQPSDYTSTSGTLTFTPGQTTRTITVPVIGETVPEANETFFVNLSGATNATITDNQGLGTITNDDVPVTVSPGSIPNGNVGSAYSQSLSASGGTSPYSFAITAGGLPAGLTLSGAGVLSGTPTAGGTFTFTVTATDSAAAPGPFTGSQVYSLTIADAVIVLPPSSLPSGTDGIAYSADITPASGGTAPYSYAVTAGSLPGGLTLSGISITGTPTATGTFNFSITATDSSTGTGPYSVTQSYSIAIAVAAPIASASSLTVAYNAPATNLPLNLSGGPADSVVVTTAPAHGTVLVSGTTMTYQPTPGYAGPDSFAYTASNVTATSAPATVSVTVQDPVITIVPSGSLSTAVAAPYSQTFTFNGGAQPWSGYQVTNLPTGLSITGTTANSVTISGTPSQAGTFNLNVSATDSSTGNGPYTVGQAFALTVDGPTLTLTPAAGTLSPSYGSAYSQTFAASGGIGSYSYALTGALPSGLTFDGATGVISGTPTVTGSFPITVTATDTGSSGLGAPFSVAENYTLTIAAPTIVINPVTLTGATAGTAYNQSLSASGAIAPYSYAVTAGALPAGLTLSTGGVLSGTATASGSFNFTVTAADAHGQTGSRAYTFVVAVPTLVITPSVLPGANMGQSYSQTISASGGTAPYSFAISTGALPTGLTLNPTTGLISGTPTASGAFNVTIRVTDSTSGTAGTATIAYTLNVTARPNPANDPEVRALNDAQIAATRRFGQAQIDNISQRLQQLHEPGGGGFSNSMRLAATMPECIGRTFSPTHAVCGFDGLGPLMADGNQSDPGQTTPAKLVGPNGVWMAGSMRFGQRDAQSGRPSYDFRSEGITMGMDHRFGDSFAAGVAFGYGHDRQDVGDNGSRISASAKSVALYGSHKVGENFFVDWLGGYQWLDFGLRRYATPTHLMVDSDRSGHQWFGSISAVADWRSPAWRFAPYLRLDTTRGTLGAYAESSGSLFDLAYLDQSVDYTSMSVGARYERYIQIGRSGHLAPRVRLEYQYDIERKGVARVGYVDQTPAQFSTISGFGFSRDRVLFAGGAELAFDTDWSIDAEYSYRTGSDALGDNTVRVGLKARF
jgi:hypothetical protein